MFVNHTSNTSKSHTSSSVNFVDHEPCQANIADNETCGEVRSLEILKEFQKLYESKINNIKCDCECSGTKLKIQMLYDWVKDLTEQNTLLVKVVEELEQEASHRVALLEEKLRNSSKTSYEIMQTLQDYDAQNISSQNQSDKKIIQYQSDIDNLTKFVKRVRKDGEWNSQGLNFYNISEKDLDLFEEINIYETPWIKELIQKKESNNDMFKLKEEINWSKNKIREYEEEQKIKDKLIQDQSKQIKKLHTIVERCNLNAPDRDKLREEINDLRGELKSKSEEFNKLELEKLNKVMSVNDLLESDLNYMKQEMAEVTKELKVLQDLLREANNISSTEDTNNVTLQKSLTILRSQSDTLIEQLRVAQTQVSQEIKINETNSATIIDLQKQLDVKEIERQHSESELKVFKSKLNISFQRIQEYDNKIIDLEKQLDEFQNSTIVLTKEEMLSYNTEIKCFKEKIDSLNKILNVKMCEILSLHAELNSKSDIIANIVSENQYLTEANNTLHKNICSMDKQLKMYQKRCEDISKQYNSCKIEIKNIQHISTSNEELQKEKHKLVEELEKIRNEDAKFKITISELQLELDLLKKSLKIRDQEKTSAQNEILSLKDEINRLTKSRTYLLQEKEQLQNQLSKVNLELADMESRNLQITNQLQKYLEDIHSTQEIKEKLNARNMQLEMELVQMHQVLRDLNQEIRCRNESVITLEQELNETKSSRDEICAESKIVVDNVRKWLEEQKIINVQLTNTVREKNLVIDELTMERNLLLKNIKEVCERYENLTEELHLCRQYVTECEAQNQGKINININNPLHRLGQLYGSQESISSESSAGSAPAIIEHTYEEEIPHDNWLNKVNNVKVTAQKLKMPWQKFPNTKTKTKSATLKEGASNIE